MGNDYVDVTIIYPETESSPDGVVALELGKSYKLRVEAKNQTGGRPYIVGRTYFHTELLVSFVFYCPDFRIEPGSFNLSKEPDGSLPSRELDLTIFNPDFRSVEVYVYELGKTELLEHSIYNLAPRFVVVPQRISA